MYYHETWVKERIRFEHIFLQFGKKGVYKTSQKRVFVLGAVLEKSFIYPPTASTFRVVALVFRN